MSKKTAIACPEKKASTSTLQADNSPLLKDLNITPGSILDLDGDGRNDIKEMPLAEFEALHEGDINAQKIHKPALNPKIAQPLQTAVNQPSNRLDYFPQEDGLANDKNNACS